VLLEGITLKNQG